MADARRYLEIGSQDTTADNLTYELAYGSRLLVDAHLESGAVDQAVEQLESGALDFVKQKHPAITKSSLGKVFNRETYKLAIKTYLAAMRKNEDKQTWIDKVRGALAPLRDELNASNDPKDRQRVTGIERYIAQELKKQFEQFESIADKSNFARILATFMGSIEKDSTDATTVLWSGETLLGVAEGLSLLGADDVAKPLFQQAESALNRAEALGFAGDPREEAMQVKLSRQRALSQRGAGKFEAAIDQLKTILKANPMSLQVQVDAADTLHLWAKSSKRSKGYAEAMMGMEKVRNPKTKKTSNLIWGWRGLVKATQGSPKYVDTYFHSMYHLIESRFEYGLLENSSKAIKSSLNDVNRTITQSEKKMDEVWKQKFAKLRERIVANSK
jgi:tetratricopeptide (TPR) repeat protein